MTHKLVAYSILNSRPKNMLQLVQVRTLAGCTKPTLELVEWILRMTKLVCLRRPSFVLPGISVIRFASEALAYLLPSFNIINHYPLDENYENLLTYPVDSDLYNG